MLYYFCITIFLLSHTHTHTHKSNELNIIFCNLNSALAGGLAAWRDPINCVFPFVVLLGYGVQNVDKVCTALSMACVAQKTRNTCIILASDGVELGIKGKLKGDETSGEPFLTISEYLKQFTESGGVIFCCTSCVKLRKAMDNMEPFCVLASAPDVVRWLSTCKGSLQFA